MALRRYGPMSGTPGKHEKTRKEEKRKLLVWNCRNCRNCRLLDRYPGIQASVVGEQLLATLAVRKQPCRPRIGYRLRADALLVARRRGVALRGGEEICAMQTTSV